MEEIKKIKSILPFAPAILTITIVFFILMIISESSMGDSSHLVSLYFTPPFSDDIEYMITSPFGERINPITNEPNDFHNGIDMIAPVGTEIVASADGYIVYTGFEEESGEVIVIEHKFDGITYQTVYAHLLEGSTVVTAGQIVQKKEKIATIGNSGSSTTGTHCHFEIHSPVRKYDRTTVIDPTYIVTKQGGNSY